MKKYLFTISLVLFLVFNSKAQVVINAFNSGPFIGLNDLFQLTIINTSTGQVSGTLEVEVKDRSGNLVFLNSSGTITLGGAQLISGSGIYWPSTVQFGIAASAQILEQTGYFPNGDFTVCYRFKQQVSQELLGVNCKEKTLAFPGDFRLIFPLNYSEVITTTPILSWQPLVSFGSQVKYYLKLVEVRSGQSKEVALGTNPPLVNLQQIESPTFPYSSGQPTLVEGNTYAWQVIALINNQEIARSEVWQFKVKKTKEERVITPDPTVTYLACKPRLDGGFYLALNQVNFSYNNRRNESTLNYSIYPSGDESSPIGGLSTINLDPGMNEVTLQGSTIGLTDGEYYVLKITMLSGKNWYLPIHYENNEM